jgi:Z1 domain.
MAEDMKFLENMVMLILRNKIGSRNPSEEDIREAIGNASLLSPITVDDKIILEKTVQSKMKVRMDMGTMIVDAATYHPWLPNRRASIVPYYWDRYKDYLIRNKGWNDKVVDRLGDVSDEILNLIGNPMERGAWKRKGLILGDIQSGKTSNYIALCNKAADAGYKVVILLTGTLETLRKQTQERVDAGFIGLNSRNVLQRNPEKRYIGVGLEDSSRVAYPFTDILQDFSMATLQRLNFTINGLPEPVVLVLKKNKSVLTNMETWLRTCNTDAGSDKIDLPMLLIDDEADNASVNTKKEDEEATAINQCIKKILGLFLRSSYVAVTATPFANIFINPDHDKDIFDIDLFPSDFIYALSSPTNYIGSEEVFGVDAQYEFSVIEIKDSEDCFRSDAKSAHIVPDLPLSLRESIAYFFLVNTIHDLKGTKTTHRSMLVNVSQYVNVQGQVYEKIGEFIKSLKQSIQHYAMLVEKDSLKNKNIAFLKTVWEKCELNIIAAYSWETVQHSLYSSTSPIEIRLVNQRAKQMGIERLDYEPYEKDGLRVIAVGGNSLSRGLTLEGLCVSYFDRNSQMYDTLMQMGRWFGYRDGYEDLFRIWMRGEAITWYQYITEATAELRGEIQEMQRIGLTPREFGLKVRQDLTSLFVTAKNKMRSAETVERWISVAAELIESPRLIANRNSLLTNLKATNDFIIDMLDTGHQPTTKDLRLIFKDIPSEKVADYIRAFLSHPSHFPFSSRDLSGYIKASKEHPLWDVVIYNVQGQKYTDTKYLPPRVIDLGIYPSSRIMRISDSCLLISGQRARVGVPGATKYGLEEDDINRIEEEFRAVKGKATIPDKPYLRINRKPILLIYYINIDTEQKQKRIINSNQSAIDLVDDMPVIGLGLGFPGSGSAESLKVRYVINKVEQSYFNFSFANEEDDEFDEN